jgi:lysophospholipase L1-like esterase
MAKPSQLKLLALGDSYTIGEAVDESERWPVLLFKILNEAGVVVKMPQIVAKTGWTTDELNQAIDDANIKETFHLVSLLIGVNNQYRGRSVENYKIEFEALLKRAIKFAGNEPPNVFVLSIPDWGCTPFAEGRDRQKIAEEIDAYNLVNKQISESLGVKWFDITTSTRKSIGDLSLLAADGLHPSGKNYKEWATIVASWLLPKIHNSMPGI